MPLSAPSPTIVPPHGQSTYDTRHTWNVFPNDSTYAPSRDQTRLTVPCREISRTTRSLARAQHNEGRVTAATKFRLLFSIVAPRPKHCAFAKRVPVFRHLVGLPIVDVTGASLRSPHRAEPLKLQSSLRCNSFSCSPFDSPTTSTLPVCRSRSGCDIPLLVPFAFSPLPGLPGRFRTSELWRL